MNHLRIATYDVLKGTSAEVAELVQGPDGLLEIFQAQAGFQAYSVIEVDPVTMISISVWATHEEAETAVREAAQWVATHLDGRVHRTSNQVGDAMFWVGVAK
jgi:heme-degrading monooxygenase HmoA